jgi:hypothetical protein
MPVLEQLFVASGARSAVDLFTGDHPGCRFNEATRNARHSGGYR